MISYEKTKIAITYRMLGAEWFIALKAMEFAKKYHNGKRKDGNPEFSHQIWIANYAITLPIMDKNLFDFILAIIFLHDTCEDYAVLFEQIEQMFGKVVRDGVEALTKVINGVKLDTKDYYDNISQNPLAALAKGCDRLHNLSSMVTAFTIEKQKAYIKETKEYVLPMLKRARKENPVFELAFENIKQSINSRITLIEAIHDAKSTKNS